VVIVAAVMLWRWYASDVIEAVHALLGQGG
jgi:hypothetical protein